MPHLTEVDLCGDVALAPSALRQKNFHFWHSAILGPLWLQTTFDDSFNVSVILVPPKQEEKRERT